MFSVLVLLLSFTGESIASVYSYGRSSYQEQGLDLRVCKKADSAGLQWAIDLICDAETDDESSSEEGIRESAGDNFLIFCGNLSSFLALHQSISEWSCRNYCLGITNTKTVSLLILYHSWKNFPG
jgi:hypothetical protein